MPAAKLALSRLIFLSIIGSGFGLTGSTLYVVDALSHNISEYTGSGAVINSALIPGQAGGGNTFVISGSVVYSITAGGTIGEYSTSGATLNADLISGITNPSAIAISGSDLFIASYSGGTIGEYTTSGATVNANLITGLVEPQGLTISGSDLFVANGAFVSAFIGEYTTSGATVNTHLVSNLPGAYGLAILGSDLLVAQRYGGTVGEYNATTGATVNASFISDLGQVIGISVSGANIYVADPVDASPSFSTVSQYSATGSLINAALVTGGAPTEVIDIASTTPEPGSLGLTVLGIGLCGLVVYRRKAAAG